MRTGVRCVLAVIGTAASVVVTPAGVSLAAANESHGFAIASISPGRDEVVGVAHPIQVRFKAPITNPADRQAAERAVDVKSTPAMTGKFEWLDNKVVQWVPDRYWPAHSTIPLTVGGA
ncbi:Ig-like domain-containing protein, partial [Mycobacterium sp. 1245852.3]